VGSGTREKNNTNQYQVLTHSEHKRKLNHTQHTALTQNPRKAHLNNIRIRLQTHTLHKLFRVCIIHSESKLIPILPLLIQIVDAIVPLLQHFVGAHSSDKLELENEFKLLKLELCLCIAQTLTSALIKKE
jgi:hypothetical protein